MERSMASGPMSTVKISCKVDYWLTIVVIMAMASAVTVLVVSMGVPFVYSSWRLGDPVWG